MTKLDTIFDTCASASGFSWIFVYENADRNVKVDRDIDVYPCILRAFNEPTVPLFDAQSRMEKEMSLYIIHKGFTQQTAEEININLEEIMTKFVAFRELLRRAGVEVIMNGRPFPNWERTNGDEYGYVFNLTIRYSICQY
jgi:hypothetical protein